MKSKILAILISLTLLIAISGCTAVDSNGNPITQATTVLNYPTTITASSVTATTLSATTLNAPTGRTASYVIAASDATALQKNQADQVLAGTVSSGNDATAINAEIVALNAIGTQQTLELVGDFYTTSTINALANVNVTMTSGSITCNMNNGLSAIMFNGQSTTISNAIWTGLNVYRTGTTSTNVDVIQFTGNINPSVVLSNTNVYQQMTSTATDSLGSFGVRLVGGVNNYAISPTLINVYALVSGTEVTGTFGIAIWTVGLNSAPQLFNCTGQIAASSSGEAGILITEVTSPRIALYNCTGYGGIYGIEVAISSPPLYNCTGYADEITGIAGICIIGGAPLLQNCNGYGGIRSYSHSLYIDAGYATNDAPIIQGGNFGPLVRNIQYIWTNPNGNLTYLPVPSTVPYTSFGNWAFQVSSGAQNVTVSIGTYSGGNNIANAINLNSVSSSGYIQFYPTIANLTANTPLYFYFSAQYTGRVYLLAQVGDNPPSGDSVRIGGNNTSGQISGANIYQMSGIALRITYYTSMTFQNCNITSYGGQAAIYSDTAYTSAPISSSIITGTITGITSFISPNSNITNSSNLYKNGGSASIADGGTITCSLIAVPTNITLVCSTAGDIASVTSATKTTITVAIKIAATGLGDAVAQNVYWMASVGN